ncbi:hypothetical protein EVAR_14385_1 [Eumeta japonica]|uniref:Uncharacterized protein n=1 Tax=Eumeta variegata TaxID=151549 RepID=A0A4C1TX54_EUMVA|nr:hypothetical protein EVAR_14385_1 [Eumeta japonica]
MDLLRLDHNRQLGTYLRPTCRAVAGAGGQGARRVLVTDIRFGPGPLPGRFRMPETDLDSRLYDYRPLK